MDLSYLAVGSVLVLTGAAAIARTVAKRSLCPVCLGVSATWAWLLVARWSGIGVDPALLAVLMGGSAVAGAGWIEARLPAGRSATWWKALSIPAGLAAAYGVATGRWIAAVLGVMAVAVLLVIVVRRGGTHLVDPAAVARLEERMKRCC